MVVETRSRGRPATKVTAKPTTKKSPSKVEKKKTTTTTARGRSPAKKKGIEEPELKIKGAASRNTSPKKTTTAATKNASRSKSPAKQRSPSKSSARKHSAKSPAKQSPGPQYFADFLENFDFAEQEKRRGPPKNALEQMVDKQGKQLAQDLRGVEMGSKELKQAIDRTAAEAFLAFVDIKVLSWANSAPPNTSAARDNKRSASKSPARRRSLSKSPGRVTKQDVYGPEIMKELQKMKTLTSFKDAKRSASKSPVRKPATKSTAKDTRRSPSKSPARVSKSPARSKSPAKSPAKSKK